MSRKTKHERAGVLRTYVVVLKADDGRRASRYTYASSADKAKHLARKADPAPPDAVACVRLSEFEGVDHD